MKQIGSRIKELRREKGMTLKELGNAIDFNYSNLSKIERGDRKPTLELLESLAEYFDKDVSFFFGTREDIPEEIQELGVEWVTFSEEMKSKNITLSELKVLAETLATIKNNSKD